MADRPSTFLEDEDVKSMLRFKEGDGSAFEALLDKYHAPIINFIYRFIGDEQESEDLAQEVFLRIYRCASNYTPQAKFSTWIYRIAKNLTLNELRRKKIQKTSSLEGMIQTEEGELKKQFSDDKPSSLQELERQDLIDIVRKAIDSLPPNQKTAVILSKYEGLSYEEIAKVIGCSVSAVKSLLSRARDALKKRLGFYVKGK